MIKHDAIYTLYSNVVSINGEDTAYDASGNLVNIDQTAVAAKVTELSAVYDLVELRAERNKKLSETDYWAMPDTPDMTTEQIAYRQALRDITNTYQSLDTVVWPTKPE